MGKLRQLHISFMQNEIGSSFRSLRCEGMLEKGCSNKRHGSKSSAHYVNRKFSLASAGLRSAFPVVILKSKAERSGEGYWQAAFRAEQQPPTVRAEAEEAGCETWSHFQAFVQASFIPWSRTQQTSHTLMMKPQRCSFLSFQKQCFQLPLDTLILILCERVK